MSWTQHIGMEIPAKAFTVTGWFHQHWHTIDDEPKPTHYGVLVGHDLDKHGYKIPLDAKILCCETYQESIQLAPKLGGRAVMGVFRENAL